MDQDTKEILKSGSKAVENVTEIFNKLAGPLAEELGQIFGDKAREYRVRNWIHVLQRTKKMLHEAKIDPRSLPPRLFLPLMEAASLENEETLQEAWASLLANAANPESKSETRTAYIDILKQMSAADVEFLNRVYESPRGYTQTWIGGYTVNIGSRMQLRAGECGPKDSRSHDAVDEEILDSVIRLGLVAQGESRSEDSVEGTETIKHFYYITTFGVRFIESCRPPQSKRILDLNKDAVGTTTMTTESGALVQSTVFKSSRNRL